MAADFTSAGRSRVPHSTEGGGELARFDLAPLSTMPPLPPLPPLSTMPPLPPLPLAAAPNKSTELRKGPAAGTASKAKLKMLVSVDLCASLECKLLLEELLRTLVGSLKGGLGVQSPELFL